MNNQVPDLLWKFKGDGKVYALAAAEGSVCFGTGIGKLYTVNTADGRLKYRADLGPSIMSVAIKGNLVFAAAYGNENDHVCALELRKGIWKKGKKIWRLPVKAPGCLTTDTEVLYVGTEGSVSALDMQTGYAKWTFPNTGYNSGIALLGTSLFVCTFDLDDYSKGYVYAIDAQTGTKKWISDVQYHLGVLVVCHPVVVAGAGDSVIALDINTGHTLWQFATDVRSVCSSDRTIFAASSDRNVYAFDVATGVEKWMFRCDDEALALAVGSGVVYACSMDNNVYALDSVTGECIWVFKSPEAGKVYHPDCIAVVNSTVCFGCKQTLYALQGQMARTVY